MPKNKLLLRQIQRHLGGVEGLPDHYRALLADISNSYDHYEKDRGMLERSIDLSSNEMIELNTKLRKESEDLQNANTELRTLFESIEEMFFSFDSKEQRFLQVSPACEKIFGYKPEDFFNDPHLWKNVTHPDDRHVVDRVNDDLLHGQTVRPQYRIVHGDGSVRWVEYKIVPQMDANGKLARSNGVVNDITEKKLSEQRLKESELRFRSLIENSEDMIAMVDAACVVQYESPSVRRILGYKDDVVGVTDFGLVHPDDEPVAREAFAQALANPEQSVPVTYRIRHKEERYVTLEGTIVNLLHLEGVNAVVANLRDVTARKMAEDALVANNAELKKSNSELDKFVYSVSHDLRAPLCSMKGIIEITNRECDNAFVRRNLGMMDKSIDRLDKFIGDILDYSRNIRLDLKTEPIDFKEMLDDIAANLEFMGAGVRKVEVKVALRNKNVFNSDPGRISVLLNNLISNAIRYQNPNADKPYVDIAVETTADAAFIVVKDNGIGIDKAQQSKVFDMFYRVSQNSVGSGLGLYIVKETVEKLQGKIDLKSEPGTGTAFTIVLPNLN